MSRKRKAPKKIPVLDPKYKSVIIPKLINSIMYDGKKTVAEKIVYDAIDKIKSKSKDEPITVFNDAINNVRPTVEVRSRRVGGATYQVPVEVKAKRSQALALRWIIDASRIFLLRLRGIDSAMIRIPNTSHGIASRPSNLITKVDHILAWFEKYKNDID
jgi:ribosomal protein S7